MVRPNDESRHIHINGIVQGVGFRPFVYNLAVRYQLGGWVLNNSSGVEIEVTGPPEQLDAFIAALQSETPPLAVIDSLKIKPIPTQSLGPSDGQSNLQSLTFEIRHSQAQPAAFTPISPDICICSDCLRELFDPADRRYRYPFINCTHCGPRFTLIRDIPYDRPLTTMAAFTMCPACQAEYDDPANRRFHAQPNACPECGPQIAFQFSKDLTGLRNLSGLEDSTGEAALQMAQQLLAVGGIVAVKGVGGFHLACDAANESALQTLRQRKGRVDKPFAVMALDITAIEQFAEISVQERQLLTSKERPIVLLKKKTGSPLSHLVAPGNPYIGVMLPYSPLHYLLLTPVKERMENGEWRMADERMATDKPSTFNPQGASSLQPLTLVMTSGNYSEEPIVTDNAEAWQRLSPLADAFLLHNRAIHVPCDDSVVRVFEGRELPLRRSRGYAPFPVKLPFSLPPILAVGGELKNTFCLTRDSYAFMSQHLGDMEKLETWQAFEKAVNHMQTLFRVVPQIIACDMHPGYFTTQWAERMVNGLPPVAATGSELSIVNNKRNAAISESPNPKPQTPIALVRVQHHHAHIAAVMAENGLDGRERVIGLSFDGTGYGSDGAIWGGEILLANYVTFTRAAHLKYIPLPGGDAAIKRPYRTALAHLWAAGAAWDEALRPVTACSPAERKVLRRQLETGFNTVPTSSMGRLFDAVAALAGVRQTVTYEAQAAIEFEAMAAAEVDGGYTFGWPSLQTADLTTPLEIDAAPVIRAVAADVLAGVSAPVISARFHRAVADWVEQICLWLRVKTGLRRVALSGGVFQNVALLDIITTRLRVQDFEVLTHRLVPPNDGGLALGQAVVAGFSRR